MNTNQKTRLKAEDMEWNVLKTLGLSKEQLEADGSMERLLQGMETEAIPLKFRTPVIDLSMDATLRLVPRPAFEIYKLGTILLNRKSKKNKALYTNIQCITNTHLVNSI